MEREYLPFAKSGNHGAFDADMYLPERWNSYGAEEQAYAFTETTYEASPLMRTVSVTEKGLRYTRTLYNFTGNVVKRQETLGGGNTLETAYTYDERGRLLSKATTWNGKTSDRLEYAYNAVGQLTGKSYNGKTDETLTYNIRGWLTGISSPAFRQTLHYCRES